MTREDRELLAELRRITELLVGVLGADPVPIDAQCDLGERLVDAGWDLYDRAVAGAPGSGPVTGLVAGPVNGYLSGTVLPGTIIEEFTSE